MISRVRRPRALIFLNARVVIPWRGAHALDQPNLQTRGPEGHTRTIPRSRLTRASRPTDGRPVGRFAIAAAATTLIVALAPTAATAAPTRAQFIRRGDALCRQVQRQLVPLRRQARAAKSLPRAQQWAAATTIWTAQITIQSRFNARFRALGVPTGDATARQLVAGLARGVTLARRVRDAFAARDTTSLARALPPYLRFTLALNRRVSAYGFADCGRS
jgi:hypothetical protein